MGNRDDEYDFLFKGKRNRNHVSASFTVKVGEEDGLARVSMLAPVRNQLVVAANWDRARSSGLGLADVLADMIHTLSSIFFMYEHLRVRCFSRPTVYWKDRIV